MPVIPPKPSGKRGKLAESDAHYLRERCKLHDVAILLFAKEPHMAFTNNRAEQDLRMAKVKHKVSGCFRAEDYTHAYCRISSFLTYVNNEAYDRTGVDMLGLLNYHLVDDSNIAVLSSPQPTR